MANTTREPAVAGQFYPRDADELARAVADKLSVSDGHEVRAAAIMVPHAGYVYSAGVAGEVFARVTVPETVILLCPNHTGRGQRIAVYPDGVFRIPGADIPVDHVLAHQIIESVAGASADREAHRGEHAIEVELPFLVAKQPALRIVPIVLAHLSADEAIAFGHALAALAAQSDRDILLVASSDMSHYLSDVEARQVDHVALAPLLEGSARELYQCVSGRGISMCGFIPATVMLAYAAQRRGKKPELVAYATSGDAFGDRSRVVGYAGVIVEAA